jgi:hypothetical protein
LILPSSDKLKKLLSEIEHKFPYLTKLDKFNIANTLPSTLGDIYLQLKKIKGMDESEKDLNELLKLIKKYKH